MRKEEQKIPLSLKLHMLALNEGETYLWYLDYEEVGAEAGGDRPVLQHNVWISDDINLRFAIPN